MNPIINQLFYTLKPLIPRTTQIALRRLVAQQKRRKSAHIWPIDPNSGVPPEGWTGWPDGKKFALVLSHDVDTRKGYDNVLKLAELEEQMGFRSCFSFVPERYGTVSPALLEELRRRGFDVAVHGLKHDGKMFLSRQRFDCRAKRVNRYLKEWKTEGFTSPSMHHNLEWLSGLNIKYSISTFDTDPFEPQPDGVGTIFPFWVNNSSPDRGFVEMPYTLPQDFTLFIILQERSIEIWKQKLDWVVRYGGMALLTVHPDYMDFGDGQGEGLHYPVARYIELLDYINSRYAGEYYHATPSQIAAFYAEHVNRAVCTQPTAGAGKPTQFSGNKLNWPGRPDYSRDPIAASRKPRVSRRPLRVAMLAYSFYESDNRVRRYAETLARIGDTVDVISLRREGQGVYNELNGVRVFRVQERVRDEKGKAVYLSRILKFFFRSAALLTGKHFSRPYHLVHVHSVPDFEVFAALIPRITGAKVILDIHDPMPDFFSAKFGYNNNSIYLKSLKTVERCSLHRADHVITVTDYWRDVIKERSRIPGDKISTIVNYPDREIFNAEGREERKRSNDVFTILYPGTLNKHCGLHIVLKAIGMLSSSHPNIRLHIYGRGNEESNLRSLASQLNLDSVVFFHDSVPIDQVPDLMLNADIGIALLAGENTYSKQALNVKLLEFLAMGLPAIATKVDSIVKYLGDGVAMLSNPNDPEDVARCIKELYENFDKREKLRRAGLAFSEKNNWQSQADIYFGIIQKILADMNVRQLCDAL
jgi:glycosyltransferase involved in cell wall biosynthesis